MAKDLFHNAVRTALENEGWLITHDPYPIRTLGFDLDVDLGAERILAAERTLGAATEQIAVEIKSFLSASFMRDFHNAVGQYTNYHLLIQQQEPVRTLYLAVPKKVFERRFTQAGVQFICQQINMSILVFDEQTSTIDAWKK
jgi:hypothetical protein